MKILINASNLKKGGALQVAYSIISLLKNYSHHSFIIVLPKYLDVPELSSNNIRVVRYTQNTSLKSIVTGRDKTLDQIVNSNEIDAVLTIFGPSKWHPQCFHLCGFAIPHIVLKESPYWATLSKLSLLISQLRNSLIKRDFKKNNNVIWCENEFISIRLRKILNKQVYTVTNTFHQIYDDPKKWDRTIKLPPFQGFTLLTISAYYSHKNLEIALDAIKEIRVLSPNLNVRFVLTIEKNQYPPIPEEYKNNFVFLGPVSISQCPYLYQQSDLVLQPSLLECFSATYAEAMKMEVPIITTDLGFAHSLCGKAAEYYDSMNPKALAQSIIAVLSNPMKKKELVNNGIHQLSTFDSASDRVSKLIKIIETNYTK